jgi:uncharacterized damage-inducible protein DinB
VTGVDVLVDAFGRIRETVHEAVDGLGADDLAFLVGEGSNSIAWLVWHLTRVQDDHLAGVSGEEQVWTKRGWVDRFDLPFDRMATGYGHNNEEVAAVRVKSGELLTGYHDEVYEQTIRYVRSLTDDDLPRIVDEQWDPPVTLSVRLVSVISDDLQHAGAATFLRGFLLRR